MNMLLNPLPTSVNGCRVHTDFRIMIQYEKILKDHHLTEEHKIQKILDLFYIDKPSDMGKAIQGLNWFYGCGEKQKTKQSGGHSAVAYDFAQDDYLIMAAFQQAYGIDLEIAPMHWWKFSALLVALPKDTLFMEIVGYRVADLNGMSKEMKSFYRKQKEKYAIKSNQPKMTLKQRQNAFQQDLDRKYYEALKQLQEKGG